MAFITAGGLANQIRKECGIAICEENDGKTVFSKEELLLVIASFTMRRRQAEENLVKETIKQTIHEMQVINGGN